MSNYRYISPLIFDRINNIKILSDECSITTDINRSSVPIMGGGFGQTLENIDDLSKKITLRGAVLLHNVYEKPNYSTGQYTNIGFRSVTPYDGYPICDLYNWITSSDYNIYYQYINSIGLNISNGASISIDMEAHSPMIGATSDLIYFLKPELTIENSGRKSSRETLSSTYLKTARTLKNYDLQIFTLSDYVSNLDYKINFSWNKIQSIPTYDYASPLVQYPSTNIYNVGQGVQAPPVPISVLSEISVKMSFDVYINGSYSGSDLENLIGGAISPNGFLKVKLKSQTQVATDPSELLTSVLRKWIDVNQMNFRLTSESISAPSEDITKISRTYDSTFKTNIFYGQVDVMST